MPVIPGGYFTNNYRFRIGSSLIQPNLLRRGNSRIKNLYIGTDRVWHPEAIQWVNNAQNNGGNVSFQTLDAVSDFCYSIDYAGIRDRFSRLNLFCGINLAAALVPLYTYFDTTDILGGDTDTNYSFVEGDYSSSTGLTGDGNNTVLDIGMSEYSSTGGITPEKDSHLSVYCISNSSYGTAAMGCWDFDMSAAYYLDLDAGGNNAPYASFDNLSTYAQGYSQSNKLGLTLATGYGTVYPNCIFNIYRNSTNITQYSYDDADNYDIPGLAVFGIYDAPSNSFQSYFIGSLGAYSFGKHMTSTQVSAYYSALQKFQTDLGRNV
jgi:hypothetical protein